MDNQELFKEIDLIQACIQRMSRNSFMLKGWTVAIYAAILALMKLTIDGTLDNPDTSWVDYTRNWQWIAVLFSFIVPLLVFWVLDAYFLRAERKYRIMYSWVLKERKEGNVEYQYDLETSRFDGQVASVFKTMFSKTLAVFYIPLVLFISIIALFIIF